VQGSTGAEPVTLVRTGSPDALSVALDATPLLGHPTGVGVFTRGALGALAARPDLSVHAFAVSWRRRQGIDQQLPASVVSRQRPMPARPLHAAWRHVDLPAIEWFIGPVDVVHGTNFVVPPTRRAGAVVSVHDLTPVHYPELCNQATLAYPGLIARALRRGAWIHADSAFVAAEAVEAFSLDPARVRVVYPGLPEVPSADADALAALTRRWPTLEGRRIILAVGTAEPRKDLPGLVRAFDQMAAEAKDLVLVLAGPPGWGEEALADAVDSARAGDRIVRTGWVDDPTLGALLASASVLAFPSRYEGFGFPPLQAMAAGVPVVATRAGSLPEVLGQAALLVDVGDGDALADALGRALDDTDVRRRLIEAGPLQAARYRWDDCAEGLHALYRDVAAAGESRHA
jgi:glycosyltransferase involved in cell wall biosynthesis